MLLSQHALILGEEPHTCSRARFSGINQGTDSRTDLGISRQNTDGFLCQAVELSILFPHPGRLSFSLRAMQLLCDRQALPSLALLVLALFSVASANGGGIHCQATAASHVVQRRTRANGAAFAASAATHTLLYRAPTPRSILSFALESVKNGKSLPARRVGARLGVFPHHVSVFSHAKVSISRSRCKARAVLCRMSLSEAEDRAAEGDKSLAAAADALIGGKLETADVLLQMAKLSYTKVIIGQLPSFTLLASEMWRRLRTGWCICPKMHEHRRWCFSCRDVGFKL